MEVSICIATLRRRKGSDRQVATSWKGTKVILSLFISHKVLE